MLFHQTIHANHVQAKLDLKNKLNEAAEGYIGIKVFWRSKDSIELHIYSHSIASAIEVIPFDQEIELPRIYLDHNLLLKSIGEDAMKSKMEEIDTNRSEGDAFLSKQVRAEDTTRRALVANLLARLHMGTDSSKSKYVEYVASATDDATANPVLSAPPLGIKPHTIVRRRRSTINEVNETIAHIAEATVAASMHSRSASKLELQSRDALFVALSAKINSSKMFCRTADVCC